MGFFSKIIEFFTGGNKFNKLTREEVVDSICSLEKELDNIEKSIEDTQPRIDAIMAKGKATKEQQMRLFYAKKINSIRAERTANIQRATYLAYNIQLLEKLKKAIDDKTFFGSKSKQSLNQLLSDQKALAVFLNDALDTRITAEQVLTDADEVFKEVEESYVENDTIYGIKDQDNELMAMFETEEMVNDTAPLASQPADTPKNGNLEG
ncbi:MAG: hypothetical protein IJY84_01970 [Clostridia bacterium]|nr:hypothetical protein [Clostridia bacterium]